MEIPGRVNAPGCHHQHCHGAFNHLLHIPQALHQIILLVQNGSHQLRGIAVAAAHLQKMPVPAGEQFLGQFLRIVDPSHRGNGIGTVMGTDHQGLGFKVRNTADPHTALHFIHVFVKFCPERGILNIVDCPVKSPVSVIDYHAGPSGSQMGMVVCPEIQVKYTILFGSNTKKSSHDILSLLHLCFLWYGGSPARCVIH